MFGCLCPLILWLNIQWRKGEKLALSRVDWCIEDNSLVIPARVGTKFELGGLAEYVVGLHQTPDAPPLKKNFLNN